MLAGTAKVLLFLRYNFTKSNKLDDAHARALTRSITAAKSNQDLVKILQKYQGQFNLFNISAMLKKVNTNKTSFSSQQQLLNKVYGQVKQNIESLKIPNLVTKRAIANIIGYTGNIEYHGIDQEIKMIEIGKLVKLMNEKQFVMAVTGLLKLGLIDSVMKGEQLYEVVRFHVGKNQNFGLLVSLWRNLIKANKNTKQLNKILCQKITKCSLSSNFKDLGYLIYCYTQTLSSQTLQNPSILLQTINKCSQNILSMTRINSYQLCIFIQHLVKLTEMQKLKLTSQFIELLTDQYVRIIKQENNLRSIANSYMSYLKIKEVAIEGPELPRCREIVYSVTFVKFIGMIGAKWESINDYQSVSSLFVQLVTHAPSKYKNLENQNEENEVTIQQQQWQTEDVKKYQLNKIIQPITNFTFNQKTAHLTKMSDKELQKLLYGLYLYKKQYPKFTLSQTQQNLLFDNLLNRKQLSELQINSILVCLNLLDVHSQSVNEHLRNLIKTKNLGSKGNKLSDDRRDNEETIKK